MNISTSHYRIQGADPSRRQFNPRVKLNAPGQVMQNALNVPGKSKKAAQQVLTPRDILSSREIETLQALFSKQPATHEFYGNNRLKNVQSGFLLDVKG